MAKKVSFSYVGLPIRNPATKILTGTIYRPLIPIQIASGKKTSPLFQALVDSGADYNLFPLEIGEQIGIDFSKIRPTQARGIIKVGIKTYFSSITLTIKNEVIETTAYFSSEIDYPLLGREGFFNLFSKLEFSQKQKKLTLFFM